MFRESRLRRIGLHAILIVSTIQGLTPDAHSVVSSWALEWLQLSAGAGGLDARHGRMAGNDRPSPSNDADEDGTTAEVVLPGESGAQTVLRRRLDESHSHPFASIGVCKPSDAPGAGLLGRPRPPTASPNDPTASHCRLTC
jgi:hypothetical protein